MRAEIMLVHFNQDKTAVTYHIFPSLAQARGYNLRHEAGFAKPGQTVLMECIRLQQQLQKTVTGPTRVFVADPEDIGVYVY